MYLIDTNVISEIRKGRRCHAAVAARYRAAHDDELFLSVLVIGEIRQGSSGCGDEMRDKQTLSKTGSKGFSDHLETGYCQLTNELRRSGAVSTRIRFYL
jgi:predicted nucleic acid-binding protein